jgi:hypothetical protein
MNTMAIQQGPVFFLKAAFSVMFALVPNVSTVAPRRTRRVIGRPGVETPGYRHASLRDERAG